MKDIEGQITELEIHERRLAAEYRMPVGDFDSVTVFEEAKRRAFAKKVGADYREDLQKLEKLHDLRLKRTDFQKSASRTGECLFQTDIAYTV